MVVLFGRTVGALEDLLSSASSSIPSSVSGIALATLGSTLILGSKHLAARWLPSSILPPPVVITTSFSLDALFETESFERALIGATPPTTTNGRQFFWTRLLLCGAIHGTGAIVLASGVAKFFLSHEEANSGIRHVFPSTRVLFLRVIAYQWLLDALQKKTIERGDEDQKGNKTTHQNPSVGGSGGNEDSCCEDDETPTIASARGPNHDDSVGAEQVPTSTNRDENNNNNSSNSNSNSSNNNHSNGPDTPNPTCVEQEAVDGLGVSELDSETTCSTSNDDETIIITCSASMSSGTNGFANEGSKNGNRAVVGGSDENERTRRGPCFFPSDCWSHQR